MIKAGDYAPEFELPDTEMQLVKLSDFRGRQNVVLYFYPKDDTSGCTLEAIDFSKREDAFSSLDTVVLGVSRDDCISHAAFRDKYGLAVQLLADTEGEACESYGVWQKKVKNGVTSMGIVRSTFIIDKEGLVQDALYAVKAEGHAADVLSRVRAMFVAPAQPVLED